MGCLPLFSRLEIESSGAMPIQATCPGCQRKLNIPDAHAGKTVKCPCGQSLVAKAAVAASAPSPPAASAAPTIGLNCPSCQRKLNVPGHLAGKAVKCPCGSQLKVPAAPAASAKVAPAAAAATATSAKTPAAAGFGGGFGLGDNADLFDELTETDLAPKPNPYAFTQQKKAPSSSGNDMLSKYAADDVRKVGAAAGGAAAAASGDRPVGLIVLAVWNFIVAAGYALLGLALMGLLGIAAGAGAGDSSEGALLGAVVAGIGIVMFVLAGMSAGVGIAAFMPKPGAWAYILFAYGFGLGDRFGTVVTTFMGDGMAEGAQGVGQGAGMFFGIAVTTAILSYLWRPHVRAYFGSDSLPKAIPFVAIAVGFVIASGLVIGVEMLPDA